MDKPNDNASIKSITEKHIWNIHLSARNLDYDLPFGGCGGHGSPWAPVFSSWSRTTFVCNICVFHTLCFKEHSTALKRECHTNFKLWRRPIEGDNCVYNTFYTNRTHFRLVAYRKVGVTLWPGCVLFILPRLFQHPDTISQRQSFNGDLTSPVIIKCFSKVPGIFARS